MSKADSCLPWKPDEVIAAHWQHLHRVGELILTLAGMCVLGDKLRREAVADL